MTSNILSSKLSISFLISLFAAILIGVFAPRALAFMPAALAIIFTATHALTTRQFLPIDKKEGLIFGLILALAFASSLWSINQDFSFERSVKLLSIFIPGAFLLSIARHVQWPESAKILPWLIGLHALIVIFLITEMHSGHQILEYVLGKDVLQHKLNRSFVVFGIFCVPLLYLIQTAPLQKIKKIILFCSILLITCYTLYLTLSQTAQLSFLTGLIFLLIFPIRSKFSLKAIAAAVLLFCLVFPFTTHLLQRSIPKEMIEEGFLREASIIYRLEVWNHAADKAMESPVYGSGIDSLRFMKSDEWMVYQRADSILHAHNAALQVWVEFGVIGILLGLALLFYIFQSIYKTENINIKRLRLSVLMAILSCAFTGYGLWQGWHLGLFFVLVALTLSIKQDQIKKT